MFWNTGLEHFHCGAQLNLLNTKTLSMDGKTKAIVAHITLIGWIIALVLNQNDDKDETASFYIRQTLGLLIMGILWAIPIVGWIIGFASFILWIISLVGAISGEPKEVPLVGKYFQDWFKSI